LQELTRCLTLGALVAHLLIGCWWHHDHSCVPVGQTLSASHVASADHDRHPCRSSERPHHSHKECLGAKCIFVRPANERLTLVSCSAGQTVAVPPPVFFDPAADRFAGQSGPAIVCLGPLRVHLLNQVLRI